MQHDTATPSTHVPTTGTSAGGLVHLSGVWFLIGCTAVALGVAATGRFAIIPAWLVAVEVFATILSLFLLGSFRYRLNKNALTYGMGMVIFATFLAAWWGRHGNRGWFSASEAGQWREILRHWLFSFKGPDGHKGLDGLIHMDTMLFILGLTFFVAVVAQTRLLEGISFAMLRRNRGRVLPTTLAITAVVSLASGVFDGVSMIGLTIRTLVIIFMLAAVPLPQIRYAVMVSTVITTVCGMWLAYGEPPNLIMKANLVDPQIGSTYLTDGFFLRYCLPGAVLAFACVAWSLRRRLRGQQIDLTKLDVLDANAASIRFMQASRHGQVLSAVEFAEDNGAQLGDKTQPVIDRIRRGQPLGLAMVHEGVPQEIRRRLLGQFVSEDLADALQQHYELKAAGQSHVPDAGESEVQRAINAQRHRRVIAQRVAIIAMVPFVGLLILHAVNHNVPIFIASFAGFAVALTGIWTIPNIRRLALREARHEFSEYYFLLPLFLSITLLTRIGFFDSLRGMVEQGSRHCGAGVMAWTQFACATGLSAILDNNVVADFASRALQHLPEAVMQLFAMAQIAGYAVGGCWTHIGSAQSVVAYAFIQRDVDHRYTPIQWIREITPVLLAIFAAISSLIFLENFLLVYLK